MSVYNNDYIHAKTLYYIVIPYKGDPYYYNCVLSTEMEMRVKFIQDIVESKYTVDIPEDELRIDKVYASTNEKYELLSKLVKETFYKYKHNPDYGHKFPNYKTIDIPAFFRHKKGEPEMYYHQGNVVLEIPQELWKKYELTHAMFSKN
jgi:hypothetical protein